MLAVRGSGISSDIEKTNVPTFLAEMDGLKDSGAVVLLLTNRLDIMDPAVLRTRTLIGRLRFPDRIVLQRSNLPLKLCRHADRTFGGGDGCFATEDFFSDKYPLYDVGRISTKDSTVFASRR